jgi:hypothetical protein
MSNEPPQLRRGKRFHKRVQRDWEGKIHESQVRPEHSIRLLPKSYNHDRRGRIDIFIDQMSDFVTVIEIKSTDWENIRHPGRRLNSHRRQVMKYVDKYLELDQANVCAGIIYQKPPSDKNLRRLVEEYFSDHCIQLLWYDEVD